MSNRKSSKRPPKPARDPGKEYPDPTPVSVPVRFKQSPSHYDEIKHMIRVAMSEHASSRDMETFEEANDFDLDYDDEPEFVSAYEFEELLPENGEDLEPSPPLSENIPAGNVRGEAPKPEPQSAPAAETAGAASPAAQPEGMSASL